MLNQVDYKHLLKSFSLSHSQKLLLYALWREPSAHLYAQDYMKRHRLTSGGIRSVIKKLSGLKLISRNHEKIWCFANTGMQAWLHAVLNDNDTREALRFGSWP